MESQFYGDEVTDAQTDMAAGLRMQQTMKWDLVPNYHLPHGVG